MYCTKLQYLDLKPNLYPATNEYKIIPFLIFRIKVLNIYSDNLLD